MLQGQPKLQQQQQQQKSILTTINLAKNFYTLLHFIICVETKIQGSLSNKFEVTSSGDAEPGLSPEGLILKLLP